MRWRMLFTDEGIDAVVPCGRCARASYEEPCRVFRTTAEAKGCANCTRVGKSRCDALREPEQLSVEERVAALAARVAALEVAPAVSCPVRALTPPATAPICALEQRVETLKQAVEGLGARTAASARGVGVGAGPIAERRQC